MRITLSVVGALCLLIGCVWSLQGINVLRGSFMSGQPKWGVIGVVLVIVGISLLLVATRRRA